ncbi:hypothetical protein BJ973_004608 [Actinoplanes tereljensis]|uniref:Uncharacterized protein n=1 Tax=Paractinoplanes tereljensis TaxID=571912 RepID=A0A919NRV0_9ACTN|nr:hypothetical protein [Actinoplanes tereljensis]GIF23994.1 hypothetical protein Ate02nite_67240 [Actinoplanes tereljensis]
MKDSRVEHFPADASGVLDFLAKDFGLDGPRTPEPGYVGYVSGRWAIWAVLEERNKTVDTFVNLDVGEKILSASVWNLVRKAKLTSAGQPRTSAVTRAGMQKSLTAQAHALRLVLPLLFADEGAGLLGDR